jgi:DNA-binding transcriptional LysR family regulator
VGLFTRAGATPVYSQYLSQVHSILALVDAGWGVALVPSAAARLRYAGVAFRELRLDGLDDARPVRLDLAWRRGNDNPALHALLERLRRLDG